MRQLYLSIALLLSGLFTFAQTQFDLSRVEIHPQYQTAWNGEFNGTPPTMDQFFPWYRTTYELDKDIEFVEVKSQTDQLGITHKRFQQLYAGIEVNHGTLILHLRDGVVTHFNGEVYTGMSATQSPTNLYYPHKTVNTDSFTLNAISNEYSAGEVYAFAPDGQPFLCHVLMSEREGIPFEKLFVSTVGPNFHVIAIEPQHIEIDAKGKASTHYIGTQNIITDSLSSTSFRLRENNRPIHTFKTSLGADFTDSDNDWNNSGEQIGTDVHFAGGLLHEFFDKKFGWDSYANNGDTITAVLNLSGSGNAFWNLSSNFATYLAASSGS
ncbi:MAG: hypothetical protein KDC76_13965, partial [Bacteroidetes bacterium]|nr:hypothetical protein [Bacteroidota bacterium]